MNKQRRKEIARIRELIQAAHDDLETVMEEEREYFDNMPESIQDGVKGQAAQENVDALEEAVDGLDEVLNNIDNIT